MKALHCITLSLALLVQPALAEDLLKPTTPAPTPDIDAGPATEMVSEPVIRATGTIEAMDRGGGNFRSWPGPDAEVAGFDHAVSGQRAAARRA